MAAYTKEQETLVLKVLSYKPHQYYEILQVSKTSSDAEVKKSYRKLAIKLHPDKNPHPRADEAFKHINKAWGVLGDSSKKQIFDQTGADPDSRFPSASASGASRSPFGAGGPMFTTTSNGAFEDDLFSFFFGNQGQGAQTFTFGGNNGFSFQTFGGPGVNGFGRPPRSTPRAPPPRQQEEPSTLNTIKQFLPIFLFILVPLLSSLFADSDTPDYSFTKTSEYPLERKTPNYKIPFYVSEKFINTKKPTSSQLKNFDSKVENVYVQDRRSKCSKEQIHKNELIDEAQGWFYTDQEKLKRAQNMPMPNCQALRNLNLI